MTTLLKRTLRALAFIGMFAIIAANFFPPGLMRVQLIVLGCISMLFAPLFEKEYFFACLQIVALSGALASISSLSPLIKSAIPVSLALICFLYFYLQGNLDTWYKLIGGIGIAFLGLGYAMSHPLVYLIGGITLVIYSGFSFRQGIEIALYWAILNTFFVFAVLYNIIQFT